MGLNQERGSSGISLHRGCIILLFFCGHCSCLQHPEGSATLAKNKAGLDQTLPLFRFGLESCVQSVSTKNGGGWVCKTLGISSCSQFLK